MSEGVVRGAAVPASERFVIVFAATAALVRLLPLQWLHPLQWDEIEFFRATKWIAEGRVPYRDFWQNHTPLSWFVNAPIAALTNSPGVDAVILMRWAQIPVWIATFWLANVWMRRAGLSRFARWSAMALALSSSFLMLPAVEYRVDTLACLTYMAGLVLAQQARGRGSALMAGAMFCLTGWANIRYGPLLVLTMLLLRVVDTRARAWRGNVRANWIIAGAAGTFALTLLYFAATHSLAIMYKQLWFENYLGGKFGVPIVGGFIHRLLVPFGIRILGGGDWFELAAVDAGGIALLLLGIAGFGRALARWRTPDDFFVMAFFQAVSLMFIAVMNFIYNYHFEIVVVMMLPFIAMTIERIPRRELVLAILAVAWCVNAFASIFRGKELDLAYQDLIMRQVDARTKPDDVVWAGIPWALRREPAYVFWLLPDMAAHLVRRGFARPYRLEDITRNPPGAVVFDRNALVWIVTVQRELGPYFVRHYFPVWRELWMPAMNGRVGAGRAMRWLVPRDGSYRPYASAQLARHRWFRDPLGAALYKGEDASRLTIRLGTPDAGPLRFDRDLTRLRKGEWLTVFNPSNEDLAVILLPTNDRVLFREPPPGATLEAETTRVTHVPQIGVRLRP